MSAMTTSGLYTPAIRTRSSASSVVPSTSNPLSWRTCTIPSLMKGWSSPTMTRIRSGWLTLPRYSSSASDATAVSSRDASWPLSGWVEIGRAEVGKLGQQVVVGLEPRAGWARPSAGIEADRSRRDEHVAGRLGLPGLAAGGAVGGAGLHAVPEFGEYEREGDIGVCVTIVVDVDPVDPVGVELRFHQERRHGAHARRVRVHVDDQRRHAAVAWRLECVKVGEIQARVVPGKPEVGRAVMVGHGAPRLIASRDCARPTVTLPDH